jgi:hypothetical protein
MCGAQKKRRDRYVFIRKKGVNNMRKMENGN